MHVRRHVYTVPTMSTICVESSCREFMSTVHVESSCREFMLRVYVERLCSDFARHVMFRLHSSYDVLRHWACSDGMFFADALSESCIFNETTTNVLSTLYHSVHTRRVSDPCSCTAGRSGLRQRAARLSDGPSRFAPSRVGRDRESEQEEVANSM